RCRKVPRSFSALLALFGRELSVGDGEWTQRQIRQGIDAGLDVLQAFLGKRLRIGAHLLESAQSEQHVRCALGDQVRTVAVLDDDTHELSVRSKRNLRDAYQRLWLTGTPLALGDEQRGLRRITLD